MSTPSSDFTSNPLATAQTLAAKTSSHHELKLSGYHLYESRYDSPFLLNHTLPPGSKLYTGPRKINDNNAQVGFLVIPPAFHPHEVALSLEHATAQQFSTTHQEHYAVTNHKNELKDRTGVFPTRRISPVQPLVALNVPTIVHGKNFPDVPHTLFNPLFPLIFSTGVLAATVFDTNRALHKSFAGILTSATNSPQQYASRVLFAMKSSLLTAATTTQLTMPLFEIGLTTTLVCAVLNRYRTRHIIDKEFKRGKDSENKLQLAPSIVSPLIITHSDPEYNIHPSANAFLGQISYHPTFREENNIDEKKLDQNEQKQKLLWEKENQAVLSNRDNYHSALCNIALDVPQPLPSTANMLFDCFDPNGDLITAFTGDKMASERAQSEHLKQIKARQRESKILQHLPLFFSKIPNAAYEGIAALLLITYGVTKTSHAIQKYTLNRILNKSSMVLRNIYLENQHQHTSMRLPPSFMNQVVYTQQSSVLFPALAKTQPIMALRAILAGLFTTYCYKIIDQGAVTANTQEHQSNRPRCTVLQQQLTPQMMKNYYKKMLNTNIDKIHDDTLSVPTRFPLEKPVQISQILSNPEEVLDTINFSHQASYAGPEPTTVVNSADSEQLIILQELKLKERFSSSKRNSHGDDSNADSEDNGGHFGVGRGGNAAIGGGRFVPNLSIHGDEGKAYHDMLEELIPQICTGTRSAIESKLIEEWLPPKPKKEQFEAKFKEFVHFFDRINHDNVSKNGIKHNIDESNFGQSSHENDDNDNDNNNPQVSPYSLFQYFIGHSKTLQNSQKKPTQVDATSSSSSSSSSASSSPSSPTTKPTPNDVILRTFWTFPDTPLPSAVVSTPIEKNSFFASSYSAISTYLSKQIDMMNKVKNTSGDEIIVETITQSNQKEIQIQDLYNNAAHHSLPPHYPPTLSTVFSQLINLFTPLSSLKPSLPEKRGLTSSPHTLDSSFPNLPISSLFNARIPDYKDVDNRHVGGVIDNDLVDIIPQSTPFDIIDSTSFPTTQTNQLPIGPSYEQYKSRRVEIERDMKGDNTSIYHVTGVVMQKYFQLMTVTTLISVPIFLTSFEYFHQKNLSYLTHSFGIPHVSEVGTPGMLTQTQAMTSVNPWLLNKGMKHNSKRIFGVYNKIVSIRSTMNQIWNIFKNSILPSFSGFNSNKINNTNVNHAEQVAVQYGASPDAFSNHNNNNNNNNNTMNNLKARLRSSTQIFSIIIKTALPLLILYQLCNLQLHSTLKKIQKSSLANFNDERNGVSTDSLLLNNSSLVYFDKQSPHNIKLRSHIEEEKRKLKEKSDDESLINMGPQQTVKRLFDNALKRAKQQAKMEDVKKKEEEFEHKLDENGDLKLTRKQRLVKFFTYLKNILYNEVYIEPKSCEKKFNINIHNIQGAISSNGVMLSLLQEHLRKEFISKLQDEYDAEEKRLKEEQDEEIKKSLELNNGEEEKKIVEIKKKKIENDKNYPKQPEKTPNFRYMHILQKSNTFMLLDQQDLHNEYEYVYHILHKRYKKSLQQKKSDGNNEGNNNNNNNNNQSVSELNQEHHENNEQSGVQKIIDVVIDQNVIVDTNTLEQFPITPTVVSTTTTTTTTAAAATPAVNERVYNGVPFYFVTSPL
jgi:hypothetical protein